MLASIFTTLLIGFALFSFLFYYTKPIPYAADLFELEETADGTLVLNYFGESHAGTHETHPLEVEINGEVKKISLIYYDQTIAHSPTSNLTRDKRNGPDRSELIESQTADAVYYGKFDLDKVTKKGDQTWEELLSEMTLIWER